MLGKISAQHHTPVYFGHTAISYYSVFTHAASMQISSIRTKEIVNIRKQFNSHKISFEYQNGRRFIVLEQQYGRRDVM